VNESLANGKMAHIKKTCIGIDAYEQNTNKEDCCRVAFVTLTFLFLRFMELACTHVVVADLE